MISSATRHLVASWLERPLCRRYTAIVLRSGAIHGSWPEGAPGGTAFWALGCTSDGDSEILGAWMPSDTSANAPTGILSDLQLRGVQSIRFLLGCDAAGICNEPIAPFQEGVLVESISLLSLRPATRRAVASAVDLVYGIHRRLDSAVARQGAIANELERFILVAEFLKRVDRQLNRPTIVSSRHLTRAAEVVSAAHG
ncbi:transposase [Burkholderiaceae bacterium UC74_6]